MSRDSVGLRLAIVAALVVATLAVYAQVAGFDFVLTDGQEILASYGFLGGATA